MEEAQQLVSLSAVQQILAVWGSLSQAVQDWLLSPAPFMALASKLTMIPAVVVLAFGLFAAIFGGRSIPFRIIAVIPGLVAGWVIGGWCASLTGLSPQLLAYGLALLLAILGGFKPVALFSLLIGILGALFTYEFTDLMVRNQELNDIGRLALVFGAVGVVGFIALIAEKVTIVISSAAVGAFATVLGIIGLAKSIGIHNPALESSRFAQVFMGLVFIASGIIQYRYASTEVQRAKAKVLKANEKAREKEDREREKRFESYGKPSRKPSGR